MLEKQTGKNWRQGRTGLRTEKEIFSHSNLGLAWRKNPPLKSRSEINSFLWDFENSVGAADWLTSCVSFSLSFLSPSHLCCCSRRFKFVFSFRTRNSMFFPLKSLSERSRNSIFAKLFLSARSLRVHSTDEEEKKRENDQTIKMSTSNLVSLLVLSLLRFFCVKQKRGFFKGLTFRNLVPRSFFLQAKAPLTP